MSVKTKLTSLITTFVLLCSLLTVGVFAVKNTTFNVGGNIEFNVQGIEADIELTTNGVQNAEFNNNEEIGKDVLKKIEIRNNTSAESVASQFAKWSNLNMTFAEGQSTATIELKITNRATEEDNYIDITALADATTKDNAKIKVTNNAGGITALLKSGEDATFTITFSVIDDEYSASLEGFSVNFDMQKKVLTDFPVLSADMTYQTFKFRTIEGQTGLSVEDVGAEQTVSEGTNYYQSTGSIKIPAYVNSNGTVYPVTKIAESGFGDTENAYEGSSITNIDIPNTVLIIDYGAFAFCGELTSINLPKSLISLPDGSQFVFCNKITTLIVPGSLKTIGVEAFCNMGGLTSVVIEDGVEVLGQAAFNGCEKLSSITIPDSVIRLDNSSYELFGDTSLTTINYTGTETQWNGIDGIDAVPEGVEINFNYVG